MQIKIKTLETNWSKVREMLASTLNHDCALHLFQTMLQNKQIAAKQTRDICTLASLP